jgi:SAM-dependent methyltransferase
MNRELAKSRLGTWIGSFRIRRSDRRSRLVCFLRGAWLVLQGNSLPGCGGRPAQRANAIALLLESPFWTSSTLQIQEATGRFQKSRGLCAAWNRKQNRRSWHFPEQFIVGKPVGHRNTTTVVEAAASTIVGSVLDAGCGTGENALFSASRGHEVTGFDDANTSVGGDSDKQELIEKTCAWVYKAILLAAVFLKRCSCQLYKTAPAVSFRSLLCEPPRMLCSGRHLLLSKSIEPWNAVSNERRVFAKLFLAL